MEKALLKVTRFNSADVIATSESPKTICHDTHWFVDSVDAENSTLICYEDGFTKKTVSNNLLPYGDNTNIPLYFNGSEYKPCIDFEF